MKKKLAIGIAVILLICCITVPFSYADTEHSSGIYAKKMENGYTLKMLNKSDEFIEGSTGLLKSEGTSAKAMTFFDTVEKMKFSFKGIENSQYMVFLLSPDEEGNESTVPTSSNLIYIDQVESADNGKVEFMVYPSQITQSGLYTVYVSSEENAYSKVGNFIVGDWVETTEYTLGDCYKDGNVDSSDSLAVLQHYASISSITDENLLLAADVNADGVVDSVDSLWILQKYADIVDSFYKTTLYSEE